MYGYTTSAKMKTCGHSSCNTIIGSGSDFCDKHRKHTSTKIEEPMALVPMSPIPDEDAPEVKPVHHINRRKGHEKIMLDLLKRKIIHKGIVKAGAQTDENDQNDQDNNAAKT